MYPRIPRITSELNNANIKRIQQYQTEMSIDDIIQMYQ